MSIENAGLRLKPLFEGKNFSRSKYMCFAMSIAQIFPAELSSSVSLHPLLVGGNVSRGSRRSEMPRLPLRMAEPLQCEVATFGPRIEVANTGENCPCGEQKADILTFKTDQSVGASHH